MTVIDKALEDIRLAGAKCSTECVKVINDSHKYKNLKILNNIIKMIQGNKNEK